MSQALLLSTPVCACPEVEASKQVAMKKYINFIFIIVAKVRGFSLMLFIFVGDNLFYVKNTDG